MSVLRASTRSLDLYGSVIFSVSMIELAQASVHAVPAVRRHS